MAYLLTRTDTSEIRRYETLAAAQAAETTFNNVSIAVTLDTTNRSNTIQSGWYKTSEGVYSPNRPRANVAPLHEGIITMQGAIVGWKRELSAYSIGFAAALETKGNLFLFSKLRAVYLVTTKTTTTAAFRNLSIAARTRWVLAGAGGAADTKNAVQFYLREAPLPDPSYAITWVDENGNPVNLERNISIQGTVPDSVNLLDTEWVYEIND